MKIIYFELKTFQINSHIEDALNLLLITGDHCYTFLDYALKH